MPAKPSYSLNLRSGIELLRELPSEWVGRQELQDALGVSKTVAWRLLRHCGGQAGPGRALWCRRTALVARLETMLTDGGKIDYEVRRRERLAAYLDEIRPHVVAERTPVAVNGLARSLLESRASALPANVTLAPGTLQIRFVGMEELLSAVGAVIFALHNDYEEMKRYLETGLIRENEKTMVTPA